MEVYDKLGKADELLPLAKREQYMFTFRGNPQLAKISHPFLHPKLLA